MDKLLGINAMQLTLILFVAASLTQLIYWLTLFIRISPRVDKPNPTHSKPVSVVICARNEADNLRSLIPLLMEQDHPQFEVIIINDGSWDETGDVLKELEEQFSNLKSIHLDEEKQRMGGKKFALTLGIKKAQYDHLLLTDADCIPRSRQWITKMTEQLEGKKQIAIGISPLTKAGGAMSGVFCYDALHTAFHYIGLANAGMPYMGVGRNLAYNKELFFSSGGFKKHYNIQSGDDDLFINEVANGGNTLTVTPLNAMTLSPAASSFGEWWRQKSRHFTTAPRYKTKHKFLLSLYPASYYMLWITSIILIANMQWLWLVLTLIGIRLVAQIAIATRTASQWQLSADLGWLAPLYEMLLLLFYPFILVKNKLIKPTQWK